MEPVTRALAWASWPPFSGNQPDFLPFPSQPRLQSPSLGPISRTQQHSRVLTEPHSWLSPSLYPHRPVEARERKVSQPWWESSSFRVHPSWDPQQHPSPRPPHPISWELSALLLTAKSKLQPSFGSPPMPSLTPNRSQAGPHQQLTATQRHPRCPPPSTPISPPPTQHSWQQGDWTPPAFITRISSSPGMSPWAPALNHHSPGPLHTLA